LSKLVDQFVRAFEANDIVRRLEALEAAGVA
jgi:hypothetical protein